MSPINVNEAKVRNKNYKLTKLQADVINLLFTEIPRLEYPVSNENRDVKNILTFSLQSQPQPPTSSTSSTSKQEAKQSMKPIMKAVNLSQATPALLFISIFGVRYKEIMIVLKCRSRSPFRYQYIDKSMVNDRRTPDDVNEYLKLLSDNEDTRYSPIYIILTLFLRYENTSNKNKKNESPLPLPLPSSVTNVLPPRLIRDILNPDKSLRYLMINPRDFTHVEKLRYENDGDIYQERESVEALMFCFFDETVKPTVRDSLKWRKKVNLIEIWCRSYVELNIESTDGNDYKSTGNINDDDYDYDNVRNMPVPTGEPMKNYNNENKSIALINSILEKTDFFDGRVMVVPSLYLNNKTSSAKANSIKKGNKSSSSSSNSIKINSNKLSPSSSPSSPSNTIPKSTNADHKTQEYDSILISSSTHEIICIFEFKRTFRYVDYGKKVGGLEVALYVQTLLCLGSELGESEEDNYGGCGRMIVGPFKYRSAKGADNSSHGGYGGQGVDARFIRFGDDVFIDSDRDFDWDDDGDDKCEEEEERKRGVIPIIYVAEKVDSNSYIQEIQALIIKCLLKKGPVAYLSDDKGNDENGEDCEGDSEKDFFDVDSNYTRLINNLSISSNEKYSYVEGNGSTGLRLPVLMFSFDCFRNENDIDIDIDTSSSVSTEVSHTKAILDNLTRKIEGIDITIKSNDTFPFCGILKLF